MSTHTHHQDRLIDNPNIGYVNHILAKTVIFILIVILLYVIMLSVILLNVVRLGIIAVILVHMKGFTSFGLKTKIPKGTFVNTNKS